MANPNRPQFKDTIASTWGQAVADTVVRRYASAAARDADLAAFTAAQLAGQVVALTPTPGDVELWAHDGVAWNAIPIVKAGRITPTTNASSQSSVTFTHPYPAGWTVFGMVQPNQFASAYFCDGCSPTVTGFITTIMGGNGTGIGNGHPIPLAWICVGWPPGAVPQQSGRESTPEEVEQMLAELAAAAADDESGLAS